jgi:hypothetical protein
VIFRFGATMELGRSERTTMRPLWGGAMLLDRLEPPGRCSGCWPHDGEVAGGAVEISVLVIFRLGATMELRRSGRTMIDRC